MKIKLNNWIINFSAQPKWYEFWWTPRYQIRAVSETRHTKHEDGSESIEREFYTCMAFVSTIYFLIVAKVKTFTKVVQTNLTNPEFAFGLAFSILMMKLTKVPLPFFAGIIEYQSDTDNDVSTSQPSFSHTTPAGSDRLLVVMAEVTRFSNDTDVTNIAYASAGITLLTGFTTGVWGYRVGYKIAPNTGAQTVDVTIANTSNSRATTCAISFNGAKQSSVVDVDSGSSGTQGNNSSVSITTTEGGVACVAHHMSWGSAANMNGTGNLTQLANMWTGGDGSLVQWTYKASAGSQSATANSTSGFTQAQMVGFRSATPPVTNQGNFFTFF
jgi:hypothetical protein